MTSIETLIDKCHQLYPSSNTLLKLIQMQQNPEAYDIENVVSIIKLDGPLTLNLMRICNSSLQGCGLQVNSLAEAVQRLGYETVYRITALVCTKSINGPSKPLAYWKHAMATGIIARTIAGCLREDEQIAFTSGIFHDIGKQVLEDYFGKAYQEKIKQAYPKGCVDLEAERELLNMDHAQVGAALLRKWDIPEAIVKAVQDHHAEETNDRMTQIVDMANTTAVFIGYGYSPQFPSLLRHQSNLAKLQIPLPQLISILDDVIHEIQTAETTIS